MLAIDLGEMDVQGQASSDFAEAEFDSQALEWILAKAASKIDFDSVDNLNRQSG